MITKVESFRISFLSDVFQVCAGMNGNSLQGAAGVGKAVADWVIKGYPPGDMLHFEVQRFAAQHNNAKFLSERAKEVVGKHYKLEYPLVSEFTYGRKILKPILTVVLLLPLIFSFFIILLPSF